MTREAAQEWLNNLGSWYIANVHLESEEEAMYTVELEFDTWDSSDVREMINQIIEEAPAFVKGISEYGPHGKVFR